MVKPKMNERSSRSHTIFRMILESREKSDCENSDGAIIVSHLVSVSQTIDLQVWSMCHSRLHFRISWTLRALNEPSQTGAEGARFKEGCNITRVCSLSGQVIKKLTDESHKGYTSYRDSKLTRILPELFGRKCKKQ
ncbi:unnamed protein product [Knipowitschia caucasica]